MNTRKSLRIAITGVSRGLGQALSHALAEHGDTRSMAASSRSTPTPTNQGKISGSCTVAHPGL